MDLLFDIGATRTRIAAAQPDGQNFSEPGIFSTPASFDDFLAALTREARQQSEGQAITRAVGGLTGSLDKQSGVMINSPHLPDWNGRPVVEEMAQALEAEVRVENDADMVGLGEAVYGAGQGRRIVGYITVSTGVGGGRIVDGRIDTNAVGFEPGRQVIAMDNVAEHQSLESLTSGTALTQRYGRDPVEISEKSVWDELAETLAIGVYNTVLHWSPEVMVLGGSMIDGDPRITFDVFERRYQELMGQVVRQVPEVKVAELGSINGVWGALAYLNRVKDKDQEL